MSETATSGKAALIAALAQGGVGLLGGALQGHAQGKENDRRFAFDEQKRQDDLLQSYLEDQLKMNLANPYQQHNFDQGQAIRDELTRGVQNFGSSVGADGMRHVTGGMRIPEGGFSPATQQLLSPESAAAGKSNFQASMDPTMAALQRSAGVGPVGPSTVPQGMAPSKAGGDLDSMNDQMRNSPIWQNFMATNHIDPAKVHLSTQQRNQLEKDLAAGGLTIPHGSEIDTSGNVNQNEGFGKWAKRAGKVAAIAAPIAAAPFTGGASLALIGAASGAAGSALNGGGWKGALTGAALGAIPGGAAGGVKQAAGETVAHTLERAVLNPKTLASISGQAIGGKTGQAIQLASLAMPGAKPYPMSENPGPVANVNGTLDRLQARPDMAQAPSMLSMPARATMGNPLTDLPQSTSVPSMPSTLGQNPMGLTAPGAAMNASAAPTPSAATPMQSKLAGNIASAAKPRAPQQGVPVPGGMWGNSAPPTEVSVPGGMWQKPQADPSLGGYQSGAMSPMSQSPYRQPAPAGPNPNAQINLENMIDMQRAAAEGSATQQYLNRTGMNTPGAPAPQQAMAWDREPLLGGLLYRRSPRGVK